MSNQLTKEIIVIGKVQGVFFRKSAFEHAMQLNIKGTVKNTGDGQVVEILATGTEHSLEAFIDWCRIGPSRAKVESVKVSERPLQHFDQFKIIR